MNTWGLCKECYGITPAKVVSGTLIKKCELHGEQFTLVDPSLDFFRWLQTAPQADMSARTGMTALSITNKCNVRCPGCYALPDSSDDPDDVVELAAKSSKSLLCLMGAEPTMREDLPQLITELKTKYHKHVMIYTNGIKLEDEAYLQSLTDAGLDLIALSLHLPTYIGDKAYGSKIKALNNIKNQHTKLDHLAFSLRDMDDVEPALETILSLDYEMVNGKYVRLRAPSAIGGKRNVPAHMSTMLQKTLEVCISRGWKAEVVPFTNHIYAVMLRINDRLVMLVRWPTAEEIDLVEAQKGPASALFVPEAGETQILHQVLLTERVRSGGALPPKPPTDCPREIAGHA